MFKPEPEPASGSPSRLWRIAKECHVHLAGGLGRFLAETDRFMEFSAHELADIDRYLEYS
jgi:hypothetical protein